MSDIDPTNDPVAIQDWILARIQEDDLLGGRVPCIEVGPAGPGQDRPTRLASSPSGLQNGPTTLALEPLGYDTVPHMMEWATFETNFVGDLGRRILLDAISPDTDPIGIEAFDASGLTGAGLAAAPAAVILSTTWHRELVPGGVVPRMFSDALSRDEVVLVQNRERGRYVLGRPHVERRGPNITVELPSDSWRVSQTRPTVRRLRLSDAGSVIDVERRLPF